jgi:hypothetical protein
VIEVFAEYGAIGVIIALFVGQLVWMQKALTKKVDDVHMICIKLIDRWNKSDETTARHREDIVKEMNDVSDGISFLKGRINGSAR